MKAFSKEDVLGVISEVEVDIDLENLDTAISLTEQGADSLDMVSIIFAIQEKFNVQISDDSIALGEWLSVDSMVASLNRYASNQQ